jgi:hypothetical protein
VSVDNLLSARESLFSIGDNYKQFGSFYGETVFAFTSWDREQLVTLLSQEAHADGLEIVGPAPGFEPGKFQRTEIDLTLPADHFPNAGERLRDWLRSGYVPCNLRRTETGYQFDLPEKALKERVLFEGEYEETEETFRMHLAVGPKFDLLAFLQSFDSPRYSRLAEVRFSSLEW